MKNGLVLVFYFNCFITVDVPCIMFVYVFIVAWFMILGAMDISQKPGVHDSQTKELQQFCSKWIIRNWELGFVSVEIEMPELNSTDHVLVSCVIYGIIPYESSRWLFLGVGVALVCKVMISLLKVKEVGPSTWNSSFKSLLRVMFGFTCGLGTSQFLVTYLYNI